MPYTVEDTQKLITSLAREYAKEFESVSNEYIEKLESIINEYITKLGKIYTNSAYETMIVSSEIFELQTDFTLSKKYIEMIHKRNDRLH